MAEGRVIAYSKDGKLHENEDASIKAAKQALDQYAIIWLDLTGDLSKEEEESLEQNFGLHPLALEDCRNPNQRPKCEDYGDVLYVLLKALTLKGDLREQRTNLFLGKSFVITISEERSKALDHVRDNVRRKRPQIIKNGADFLAYLILDGVVDTCFPLLEALGEALERLEDRVEERPDREVLKEIHVMRSHLSIIRKSLWPQREVFAVLVRGEIREFRRSTLFYLRDVYDHMVQILDIIETQKDILGDVRDIYMSSLTMHMNEIIKVLTLISTIILPLSLITGVWGMNFENLPGAKEVYGFPAMIIALVVTGIALLAWYRTRGWL